MNEDKTVNNKLIFTIILAIVLIILFSILLATHVFVYWGYNSLFWFENLIGIYPFNPMFLWFFWGILIGGTIGVVIAVKKYKLSLKLLLYPIGLLFFLTIIMNMINKPLNYHGNFIPEFLNNYITVEKNYYTLTTESNVRSGPSTDYQKISVIKKGFAVEVIKKGFFDSRGVEWYKIKYSTIEGYINSKLLAFSHTNKVQQQVDEKKK